MDTTIVTRAAARNDARLPTQPGHLTTRAAACRQFEVAAERLTLIRIQPLPDALERQRGRNMP
jgi:hypothetical protein